MFSKAEFLKEFENKIMFGFLVGLNHHTQVYIFEQIFDVLS